jgi:hypothetical protein
MRALSYTAITILLASVAFALLGYLRTSEDARQPGVLIIQVGCIVVVIGILIARLRRQ